MIGITPACVAGDHTLAQTSPISDPLATLSSGLEARRNRLDSPSHKPVPGQGNCDQPHPGSSGSLCTRLASGSMADDRKRPSRARWTIIHLFRSIAIEATTLVEHREAEQLYGLAWLSVARSTSALQASIRMLGVGMRWWNRFASSLYI